MVQKILKVNEYWLDYIWGCVGEGNLTPNLNGVDIGQDKNLELLIRKYVMPSFSQYPLKVQLRIKRTWQYAINFSSDGTLIHSLENNLPSFRFHVREIRKIYIRAWGFAFPQDDWVLEDISQFENLSDSTLSPWYDITK